MWQGWGEWQRTDKQQLKLFHVLYLILNLPWGPLDDSFLRGHRLDNVALYLLGIGYRILARKELVNPPSADYGEAAHSGFEREVGGTLGLRRWLSGKNNPPANAGDPGSIHGSGGWQPTPVFLPGESHGQRSLAAYHPWGRRVRHDFGTKPPPGGALAWMPWPHPPRPS